MKKFLSKVESGKWYVKRSFLFSFFLFTFSLSFAHAYTSEDTANARALAAADIIVDKGADHAAYRLDDAITRQEVIGMTLKLK